jgi:hypothetical protein
MVIPTDPDYVHEERKLMQCDICDDPIITEDDLCTLHLQGVKEKLSCHGGCIELYYHCHGDFSLLPEGKLKRAIFAAIKSSGEILVRNTGITVREKHGRYIKQGALISSEEGYKRIHNLATIFFGLPLPLKENNEFYSINHNKQIVLLRKIEPSKEDTGISLKDVGNIIEASRG